MRTQTHRAPKLPVQQLFILSICRFAEPIALCSAHPYLPDMIASFGISETQLGRWVGITSAIFSLAQFLTGVLWGRASDRFGRKPAILAGLSCTMVTTLLFGLSQSLSWAIAARTLGGLGSGNVGIIRTMVAEIVPQKELQPRAFSIMPLIWTIGSTLGPAFGGILTRPAQRYPHVFGRLHFFTAFPFALPNLVAVTFFLFGLTTGVLFLNESLETRKYRRDYGRVLGKRLVRSFCRQPTLCTHLNDTEHTRPLLDEYRTSCSPARSIIDSRSESGTYRDTERPPKASSSLTYREVFNFQSNINLLIYTTLAFHSVAYDQTLPIFMHTSRQDHEDPNIRLPFKFAGGFGLGSSQIGFMFMIYGFFGMLVQFLIFPPVARYLGILNCLKACSIAFPLIYLMTPFTVLFRTSQARKIALMAIMFVKSTAVIFSFPSSTILLTNSAASILILGSLNGVATSAGAFGRSAGAALGGSTFTAGMKVGYIIMPWWIMALTGVLGAVPVWWLVEKDGLGEAYSEDDEADEVQEEDHTSLKAAHTDLQGVHTYHHGGRHVRSDR